MSQVLIGTSGFSYGHWYGNFYPDTLPQNELLGYYCKKFDSVEINSTFYHLPFNNVVAGWHKRSPAGFVFALKGSRYITHRLKLKSVDEPLSNFISRARLLKEKLGPVLWQLPPNLKPDLKRLEDFLKQLPKDIKHSVEFRNDDWLSDDTFGILKKYDAAYCIVSAPHMKCAFEVTAHFVYIRMHGISGWYSYNYTDDDLEWWAEKIKKFLKKKLDVYIYFNNDACGYAPANALYLKKILSSGSKPRLL